MSYISMIKLGLIGLLIAAVVGFSWWAYSSYQKMETELTQARLVTQKAIEDRDRVIGINKENLKTIETLQKDVKTGSDLIAEYKVKEAQVNINVRAMTKRIQELSKADPINTRPLSPVINETLDSIFGVKK